VSRNIFTMLENDDLIDVRKVRQEVVERLDKFQRRLKKNFDKRRKQAKIYQVGDLVLVHISSVVAKDKSRKHCAKYKGPYYIVECLENDRYRIADILGANGPSRTLEYQGVYAAESIKPWVIFASATEEL